MARRCCAGITPGCGRYFPTGRSRVVSGGLAGLEPHYRKLSERYGYKVPVPENAMNQLGYALMGWKKLDEAIAVFQRNTELYPDSANTYDSLGEGLEAAGKFDLAQQDFQKSCRHRY
jgi:tetratricopeptide (TPR) repeat protein